MVGETWDWLPTSAAARLVRISCGGAKRVECQRHSRKRAAAARAGTRLDTATPVTRAASTKTTAPKPTAAEITQRGRSAGRVARRPCITCPSTTANPGASAPTSAPDTSAPKEDVSAPSLGHVCRRTGAPKRAVHRSRGAAYPVGGGPPPVVAQPLAPEPSPSPGGVRGADRLARVVLHTSATPSGGAATTHLHSDSSSLGWSGSRAVRLASPLTAGGAPGAPPGRGDHRPAIWPGSTYLVSPLMLSSFDELLHQATLWNIIHSRTLFTQTRSFRSAPTIPASAGHRIVKWLTGVPMVVAQLTVIAVCASSSRSWFSCSSNGSRSRRSLAG